MNLNAVINVMCSTMLALLALKAMIGYHFPWETCPCCGKKYSEHDKRI